MKESFSELYARLYSENFSELEEKRKKEKKTIVLFLIGIFGGFLLASINPIFMLVTITAIIVLVVKTVNNAKNGTGEKSYEQEFKERIVKPLIENVFDEASYNPDKGMDSLEYRRAGFKESFDRYSSDDYVTTKLDINNNNVELNFAEVHTERESEDSDGNTTYTTIFHGIVSKFNLAKNIKRNIFIRNNGRSFFNKNRVKMDMSEFEKIFDVETDDKILAMRILTSDVMSEMMDLYEKYKYRFEISMLGDTIYMRLSTGAIFEPKIFGSSLDYKYIEKYYLILKALSSLATHIYKVIDELEV